MNECHSPCEDRGVALRVDSIYNRCSVIQGVFNAFFNIRKYGWEHQKK